MAVYRLTVDPLPPVLLKTIELSLDEKLDPLDFLSRLGCVARLVHWRTQTILTESVHAVGQGSARCVVFRIRCALLSDRS